MADLFESAASDRREALAPLADRMRPSALDDLVGQEHLTGERGRLRQQLERGHVPNMVLTGPPGSGKTTIARLVAERAGMALEELSAVACGLADVRRVVAESTQRLGGNGQQTVLFLDEIHRFNRAQQDALLPAVESGTIRLVGATTENPYVSINRALLSRLVVYELRPLGDAGLAEVVRKAHADTERGLKGALRLEDGALSLIVDRAGGDARTALTLLETSALVAHGDTIDADAVERASDRRRISYDRLGDQHYDHASAYIKSMRKGDAEGALGYLAAMLEGGEDPMFVARRLVIFASEDVGPGDPQALLMATAALTVTERVGLPECRITLAHVTRYCAEAPKDRQAIDDIERHATRVRDQGMPDVPLELTNRKR